jgi:hypothetical protein
MPTTLEEIKAKQAELVAMIAKLEKKPRRRLHFPEMALELKEGEMWAGVIVDTEYPANSYHLILLPDEADSVNWESAKSFASKVGGELPSRREQSLLFANLKDQFQGSYYWSSEQHAGYRGFAWCQTFGSGYQLYNEKFSCLRARAVRRQPF